MTAAWIPTTHSQDIDLQIYLISRDLPQVTVELNNPISDSCYIITLLFIYSETFVALPIPYLPFPAFIVFATHASEDYLLCAIYCGLPG